MGNVLNILITYLAIIISWLIVNIIFYALTVLTRKKLSYIPYFINIGLTWLFQIYIGIYYILEYIWKPIISRDWLTLIISLIFGTFIVYIWQGIFNLIMFPINGITTYFAVKSEVDSEKIQRGGFYDVLSTDGKTLEHHFDYKYGQNKVSFWFIFFFSILFVRQVTIAKFESGVGPIWYIIAPMLTIVLFTLIVGVFVGIINLFRKKGFFGNNKAFFLATVLKVSAIINGVGFAYELLTLLKI